MQESPYQAPRARIETPQAPVQNPGPCPLFCWLVLGMGVLQAVSIVLVTYRAHLQDPGFVAAYFSEPGRRFGMMLPVLYLYGTVMFFLLRRVSMIALSIHILFAVPMSIHSMNIGAASVLVTVLNLVFLPVTLAYGFYLIRRGRMI